MVKIVDSYSLDKLIGKGEYGKVYHAINLQTKIEVAIKVIDINKFIQINKLVQLTKNQLETIKNLQNNVNVIKFVQMIKTQRNIYLVYEYCQGGTLQDLLNQKRHQKQQRMKMNQYSNLHLFRSHSMGHQIQTPNSLLMPQKEALIILKQIINAFKSLSELNVVHRDVKPNNIFFKSGHLKLADFGFCKKLKGSDDLTQTCLGSPMYMAPQILNGDIYGSKVDIWSVGIVLYEMLFGVCPLSDCSIEEMIRVYNNGGSINVQNNILTPSCQMMLMKMLERDQFKRISWQDFFYQYEITQKGTINQREKDFQYDLMRLMKRKSNNDLSPSRNTIKLKYDWSKLTQLKSSVHSQQLQDDRTKSISIEQRINQVNIDQIYQLRKKIKQFSQQHQKMQLLANNLQQIGISQLSYIYSQEVCYIIAYNIEKIIANVLSQLQLFQKTHKKILENNPNQFHHLNKIYIVFINQKQTVLTKLRQIRMYVLEAIQNNDTIPQVIKYSKQNINIAKKIGRKYLQQFQKHVPNITSVKTENLTNAVQLVKVLWSIVAITQNGIEIDNDILSLKKQTNQKQIFKLLNKMIMAVNCH